MIFLFIVTTICKQVYDFTTGFKGNKLDIYFNHLDMVEVKIGKNIGAFFSYWNKTKDLYLNVDAINSDGDVLEYGPFDSSSFLVGVVFQTLDYVLKFTYEGEENAKIGIIFSKEKFPDVDNFKKEHYEYSILNEYWYYEKSKFANYLQSPFLYNLEHSDVNIVLYFTIVILTLFFITFYFCCKELKE